MGYTDEMTWHDVHTKFHWDWFVDLGNIKATDLRIWEVVVSVLLMRVLYWIRCWDDFRCHDIIRSLMTIGNIKGITSPIWEAAMLVLLMRGTYNVCHWHGLRWHDINISDFMKIGTGVQAILRLDLRNLKGCNVGITNGRDMMTYAIEMPSCGMIYIPSFMKFCTHVERILRFYLSNLKRCYVGISVGRPYEARRSNRFKLARYMY
jgi:hypothetical protein